MEILPERPMDAAAIESLLDIAFGPERHAKTAYRLRDGVPPLADLCFVALDGNELKGSLRFWPILAAGRPSLLLGPLAVDPRDRGKGYGRALMWHGIERARQLGHDSILLVGDVGYYATFGFSRALTLHLTLPGPVDLDRFLGLELKPGSLRGAAGPVTQVPAEAEAPRKRSAVR